MFDIVVKISLLSSVLVSVLPPSVVVMFPTVASLVDVDTDVSGGADDCDVLEFTFAGPFVLWVVEGMDVSGLVLVEDSDVLSGIVVLVVVLVMEPALLVVEVIIVVKIVGSLVGTDVGVSVAISSICVSHV